MTVTIPVLYEDSFLLVVDKPSGIIVNRAESVTSETVQDWAAERIFGNRPIAGSEEEKAFVERAGIVHRIDKETSGCLIIAKNLQSFVELQRQFKEREVHKTYLAVVHGKLTPEQGEIRAPVGRLPWNRERFGILPDGKEAVTRYRLLKTKVSEEAGEAISLVEVSPETGRTHQIRIHMKYINHPLIGDWQYAGRKTARNDRLWAHRVMLHAWKVSFTKPDGSGVLAIEAPVPDDMKSII